MEIEIKALTPDFVEDYIDFFDHRAFSDGSPYYPCYCNAFNMSAIEIDSVKTSLTSTAGPPAKEAYSKQASERRRL